MNGRLPTPWRRLLRAVQAFCLVSSHDNGVAVVFKALLVRLARRDVVIDQQRCGYTDSVQTHLPVVLSRDGAGSRRKRQPVGSV